MNGCALALRIAVSLLVVLGMQSAGASIAPPDPLVIAFQPDSDQLTPQGVASVDRLAVRSAQCGDGPLRIRLAHAAAASPELTTARFSRVRERLSLLGLRATYVLSARKQAVPPERLLASVSVKGDDYCYDGVHRLMLTWAAALNRHAEQPSTRQPAFWRAMTPDVRRRGLALPLAMAAYCPDQRRCARRLAAFHWLVDQVARREAEDVRRSWVLAMWREGDDSDLADLQRDLGIAQLTAEERAAAAYHLAASGLPWPVIEKRLLEPQVMALFADHPGSSEWGGYEHLLGIAVERRELDSFGRLIDAAGAAKACFVAAAVSLSGWDADVMDAILSRLPSWASGAANEVPAGTNLYGAEPCDLTAVLMTGAYCPSVDDDKNPRFLRMWTTLLAAGFTPNPASVRRLTTPGVDVERYECKLEPMAGNASAFKPVHAP